MRDLKEETEILDMIKQGINSKEIAKKTGRTPNNIRQIACKYQVKIHHPKALKRIKITKKDIERIKSIQQKDPFNMALKQVEALK